MLPSHIYIFYAVAGKNNLLPIKVILQYLSALSLIFFLSNCLVEFLFF